jgi:predicted 3-demethylubiquinone-9 3-methyltransferase (glyoxalase superfamily)
MSRLRHLRRWPIIQSPAAVWSEEDAMARITPCLWGDGNAEEAARFYVTLFPDSHVDGVQRALADNPSGRAGDVLLVSFTLAGQPFTALNGGPQFPFTEAVSFLIDCEDQAEVDRLWNALIAGGGSAGQCGWLKDRFGLSWQVVPRQLGELLGSPDRERAGRAMEAMLKMSKIDVEALRRAFEGEPAA